MIEITKSQIQEKKFEIKRNKEIAERDLSNLKTEYESLANNIHWFDKFKYKAKIYLKLGNVLFTTIKGVIMANQKQGIVRVIVTSILSILTYFFGTEFSPELVTEIISVILGVWSIIEMWLMRRAKKEDK